jgi:hypothetical protein
MKLIESKTLGTAAALIEFTSIPQDGTDLLVLVSARSSDGAVDSSGYLTFNGSSANFSGRNILGTGSAIENYTISTNFSWYPTGNTATANTFASYQFYIPNYAGSTNKSYSVDGVIENNATLAIQSMWAMIRSNTAAITSMAFSTPANLVAGSTISLYKITKGSDGIVTTS